MAALNLINDPSPRSRRRCANSFHLALSIPNPCDLRVYHNHPPHDRHQGHRHSHTSSSRRQPSPRLSVSQSISSVCSAQLSLSSVIICSKKNLHHLQPPNIADVPQFAPALTNLGSITSPRERIFPASQDRRKKTVWPG